MYQNKNFRKQKQKQKKINKKNVPCFRHFFSSLPYGKIYIYQTFDILFLHSV